MRGGGERRFIAQVNAKRVPGIAEYVVYSEVFACAACGLTKVTVLFDVAHACSQERMAIRCFLDMSIYFISFSILEIRVARSQFLNDENRICFVVRRFWDHLLGD